MRLADKVHQNSRLFSEIDTSRGDFLLGVADGSKLLRFRNDALQVFYMDTRPIPPLRWRITMPHGPEKLNTIGSDALAVGDLALVLYAPLINPLTDKTIGPDRERAKSVLRFEKWVGTEAEVFIATDNQPYSPGDVLADVHVMLRNQPSLLRLETPHRWWTVAPEPLPDASDITKMPTVANEKRRAEVEAVNAKAAKESDSAEKQQAEVLKAPTPKPASPSPNAEPKFIPDGQLSPMIYAMGITDEDKAAVMKFLLAHHEKVTKRQIREAVQDYADEAEFFSDGKLSREVALGWIKK